MPFSGPPPGLDLSIIAPRQAIKLLSVRKAHWKTKSTALLVGRAALLKKSCWIFWPDRRNGSRVIPVSHGADGDRVTKCGIHSLLIHMPRRRFEN